MHLLTYIESNKKHPTTMISIQFLFNKMRKFVSLFHKINSVIFLVHKIPHSWTACHDKADCHITMNPNTRTSKRIININPSVPDTPGGPRERKD